MSLVFVLLPIVLVVIGGFLFWIMMLVDCLKREFREPTEKIVWILVLCLLNVLGAMLYWFLLRKNLND